LDKLLEEKMLVNFLEDKITSYEQLIKERKYLEANESLRKSHYVTGDYATLIQAVDDFKKNSPTYYFYKWRPTMKIERYDISTFWEPAKYIYDVKVGIEKLKKEVKTKDEIHDALHVSILGYDYVEAGDVP
jgi:uncharacterized FAD-dependent dehydrogenase